MAGDKRARSITGDRLDTEKDPFIVEWERMENRLAEDARAQMMSGPVRSRTMTPEGRRARGLA